MLVEQEREHQSDRTATDDSDRYVCDLRLSHAQSQIPYQSALVI
jgi:hypothetical protein